MSKAPKRFKWKTDGVANNRAVFSGPFYRFTFLTDRLVRIEYDVKGVFEDRASQHIFYRNLPVPNFITTVDENDVLRVETEHIVFTYKQGAEFTSETLSVKLKSAPGTIWRYGEDPEQLRGTATTLDGVDGSLPLQKGVLSRGGIAVIDDSDSLVLGDDGWIEVRGEDTKDIYVFAYGHDYKAAIRDLYKITGAPPMLPNYALGNWWSRYHAYTQDEYQSLMERFERENVPFSVSVVDMDWHYVNIPEEKRGDGFYTGVNYGWTGYTWNEELFPDYKGFLKFLGDHNLKTALNLHPADGVRSFEAQYEEMAKAVGIDPETKQTVKFDLLNPDFMEKYFDILHHPYEEDGVSFWWMDWQQGTDYRWIHEPNRDGKLADPREKVDPLWLLNHLHILDISRNGKRPMFFSRYSGVGAHRYPVGFSGDTIITWRSLDYQPYFTANASNVGYSWWSHDIGGHMGGYRDDEMQVRWLQLGVLSPINRLHSSSNPFSGKEPWNLGYEHSIVAKEWLRLRHRLFPYIYTMNYRNHKDAEPLVQPMYYSHPECSEAYEVPNQYWFGSELIVAPITEKSNDVDKLAKTTVWLPEGEWFDFFTGNYYKGGKKQEVYRKLEEYPIFAKAGAIIPMDKNHGDNKLINRDEIDVQVFPGANGKFTLYQDEGDYSRYADGHFATTDMNLVWGEKPTFTIESAEGDLKLIPKKRTYNIIFRSLAKCPEFNVTINGKGAKAAVSYDKQTHSATVTVIAKSVETVSVEMVGENLIYKNADVLDRAFDILLHSQAAFNTKEELWKAVQNAGLWNMMVHNPEREHLHNALKEIVALYNLSK